MYIIYRYVYSERSFGFNTLFNYHDYIRHCGYLHIQHVAKFILQLWNINMCLWIKTMYFLCMEI